MPSYQYKDQEGKSFEVKPAGDYPLRVVGVEFGISQGEKTRGSEKMDLKLEVENPDGSLSGCSFFETLTFLKSCDWKIDTAVKSLNLLIGGQPPRKGEAIDFSEHMLIGLRGWASLVVDEYQGKKRNKVAAFITNKPKLAKVVEVAEDPDNVAF
jgi:hypothetical protein